ncbi:MAG: preprotein translocase subunit SecY [Phycisphaerales bacterium]
MFQAFLNIFKIPELRNKILFTLGMLAVFRMGHWIPLPGVDQTEMTRVFRESTEGALGSTLGTISMLSGSAFSHSTIFGLGVMPYISASIIFQLLTAVNPRLKKLQEEGATGRQKIQEWTRYVTIGLAIIQGYGWLVYCNQQRILYAEWVAQPLWWVAAIAALTAGTMFLMWVGEQIDKHGIGNGVSMIIMAGILSQMPGALQWVASNSPIADTLFGRTLLGPPPPGFDPALGYLAILMIAVGFVVVVGGSVLLTVAQRRIPIQQAKHTRGRKVFGGQRAFLPLRINHSGVMPVVFASSLMIFPGLVLNMLSTTAQGNGWATASGFRWLSDQLQMGQFPYIVFETILIYFFSYFWITVQFNPEEMAKNLRDQGSFIPGLRPGPRTAEYLETVMERITFVGAAFLAIIAVIPMVVSNAMGIPFTVAQFLGGTGLLIVVSVVLDFIQRVEANLLMRNYAGFLSGEDGKGPRIQSSRSM